MGHKGRSQLSWLLRAVVATGLLSAAGLVVAAPASAKPGLSPIACQQAAWGPVGGEPTCSEQQGDWQPLGGGRIDSGADRHYWERFPAWLAAASASAGAGSGQAAGGTAATGSVTPGTSGTPVDSGTSVDTPTPAVGDSSGNAGFHAPLRSAQEP